MEGSFFIFPDDWSRGKIFPHGQRLHDVYFFVSSQYRLGLLNVGHVLAQKVLCGSRVASTQPLSCSIILPSLALYSECLPDTISRQSTIWLICILLVWQATNNVLPLFSSPLLYGTHRDSRGHDKLIGPATWLTFTRISRCHSG